VNGEKTVPHRLKLLTLCMFGRCTGYIREGLRLRRVSPGEGVGSGDFHYIPNGYQSRSVPQIDRSKGLSRRFYKRNLSDCRLVLFPISGVESMCTPTRTHHFQNVRNG